MGKFKSKPFYYLLSGDYALFTSPITKGGGEKYTYPVPTYQAIKGITEQIYWKPSIVICIDEIKVLNQISTQSKGVLLLYGRGSKNSGDRSKYTYLKDVQYAVKYHFEWNGLRDDLVNDRNEQKHSEIMARSLKKGGRKDIFLGVRECLGYVKMLNQEEYDNLSSYYQDVVMPFGLMFHSFNYPTEVATPKLKNTSKYQILQSNFTEIVMENGVIRFCRPSECTITMNLSEFKGKPLTVEQIKTVDDEYAEILAESQV